jgi:hypothetical protein
MRCTCEVDVPCVKHRACNARSPWHDLWCQLEPGHLGDHGDGGSVKWERLRLARRRSMA